MGSAARILSLAAVLMVAAAAEFSEVAEVTEFEIQSRSNRKLQQFFYSEAWSDYLGANSGTEQIRAECPPGTFITTIRLSLNTYTAGETSVVAIGSMQGICDGGVVLTKFPPEAPNDIYFIVKQDGFTEFVGSSGAVMESFQLVGQSQASDSQFALTCPDGLRLSGYQVKSSTVIHSLKIKCSKI